MSTAPRRAEFFALEANEYLAELEPLASVRDSFNAVFIEGDAVGGQDFEGGLLGRAGEGVRVLAHVNRAGDALSRTIFADRLRDGEDVGLGEGAVCRRTTMTAGAERDELLRVAEVG